MWIQVTRRKNGRTRKAKQLAEILEERGYELWRGASLWRIITPWGAFIDCKTLDEAENRYKKVISCLSS